MTSDNTKTPERLDGVTTEFDYNADGFVLKKSQHIPQALLDSLKEQRNHSTDHKEGEFMWVASIPAVVAEKWMREGSDIFDPNVNGKENHQTPEGLKTSMPSSQPTRASDGLHRTQEI